MEPREEINEVFQEVIDFHSSSRVLLFRHFVELLVRVSLLKYGDLLNLHRSIEKLILSKLLPLNEVKKGIHRSMTSIPDDSEVGLVEGEDD